MQLYFYLLPTFVQSHRDYGSSDRVRGEVERAALERLHTLLHDYNRRIWLFQQYDLAMPDFGTLGLSSPSALAPPPPALPLLHPVPSLQAAPTPVSDATFKYNSASLNIPQTLLQQSRAPNDELSDLAPSPRHSFYPSSSLSPTVQFSHHLYPIQPTPIVAPFSPSSEVYSSVDTASVAARDGTQWVESERSSKAMAVDDEGAAGGEEVDMKGEKKSSSRPQGQEYGLLEKGEEEAVGQEVREIMKGGKQFGKVRMDVQLGHNVSSDLGQHGDGLGLGIEGGRTLAASSLFVNSRLNAACGTFQLQAL
jgi:hypothetical protein